VHDKIAISLFALLWFCGPKKDIPMTNDLLLVTAKCRANDQCRFEGQNMFLDVTLTNNQKGEVGLPLEYVRKAGPIIKLTDARSKAETYLKSNLADPSLRNNLTMLQPGKSVVVEWVITSDELRHFGGTYVDLFAELTVMAEVHAGGKRVDFRGSTTLRIVSKDKP